MGERKSVVWNYFDIKINDNSKAVCKECDTVMSRGKSDKAHDYSTSSLMKHLRSKHPALYNELNNQKISVASAKENATASDIDSSVSSQSSDARRPGQTAQPGIKDAFEKLKPWDINSDNAKRIHVAIEKMIAIDMEPYHIVEKAGFISLVKTLEKRYSMPSRKYFTDRVIPDIYQQVCSRLYEMTASATSIAFSTDTWTTDNTTESYFGLTAHWLNEKFERSSYVLQCAKFTGQHTAENLLSTFERALDKWNISREKVHVVLRDNAANITKCFREGNIASVGCFAHTVQLCVNEGVLKQRSVLDIVKSAHKIVGHFKHSSSATDRLRSLQAELNLPHHQLIQDVPTRWNSTFFMLQRLLE